jgi:alkylation response protein AidB-like acyl-CoA dehydrogenase
MDFGLSDDQRLFQDSLRAYLADRVPLERVRAVMDGENGDDPDVRQGLAAQGVCGIVIPEEHGGAGLGLLDALVAAEELGAAATPLSFHSACVMAPLAVAEAGTEDQRRRWLEPAASGEALLSFATGAPAVRDGKLEGCLPFVPDTETADGFVVVAGAGDDLSLLLLPRDVAGLRIERLKTVDHTRRVGELIFEGVRVDDAMRLNAAPAETLAGRLDRIVDAGRLMLAADALGAAERGLERAVAYAGERRQFGRVIGSFQAVKHRCAETIAEIEPLRSLLWYAAFAWDERRDDALTVASLAKAHAGEVATAGVKTAVELFGGMGFTYECDQHIWFKRAGYDRQMLGGPAELRRRSVELTLS